MMKSLLFVVGIVFLLKPVDGANHCVFPVSTDLQRTLLGHSGKGLPDVKAYVLINGDAVVLDDEAIGLKLLDVVAVRKQLETFVDRGKAVVRFNVCYTRPSGENRKKLLRQALRRLGADAGFRGSRVSDSFLIEAFRWDTDAEAVTEELTESDADETAIENGVVRVFPVQTSLSRHLTSNADCVVEILQPFDAAGFTAAMRKAVLQIAPKAKVQTKRTIQFRISSLPGGREAADEFATKGGAKELAKSVGYQQSTVSHTPR